MTVSDPIEGVRSIAPEREHPRHKLDTSYDVIVIGSGIGGLTAASLLAQVGGRRVLVLERHYKLGGFTQGFRRHEYNWDPGLHYIGEMGQFTQRRLILDLVTGGALHWQALPDPFDLFLYPELRFAVRAGTENFRADLIAAFPDQEKAIDAYLRDISRANGWFTRRFAAGLMPKAGARVMLQPGRHLALMTTGEYLRRNVPDPRLRAILASQWGCYGLPPSQSAFAMHALVVAHYSGGAWYPMGGGLAIAAAAAPIIADAGGACVVNAEVSEILVERGRALGVHVVLGHGHHREERLVRAPLVISDTGAHSTYTRLLPTRLNLREHTLAARTPKSPSMVQLFVGLRRSPRELGVTGGNLWIFDRLDHDAAFAERDRVVDGTPTWCFVSFPSMRDPRAMGHTAEVTTFADWDCFARWANQPWRRRGDEYEALKRRIADGLIGLVEGRLPGFGALVSYAELATPITIEHFTAHVGGQPYGLAPTPDRVGALWLSTRTPVRGLLLAGADAGSLGVVGAMMSGVMAAASALGGLGYFRIMRAAHRHRSVFGAAPRGRTSLPTMP